MKKLIEFFSHQHLFSNFLFVIVLTGGVFFWSITQKEELPEIAMDFVRITVLYPGASPEEVEKLVTWPIEKELGSVDGIEEVISASTEGVSSIVAELTPKSRQRDQIVTEIRNTVLSVKLPEEIRETPNIREFKNSKKAIIDLGIYFTDRKYLNVSDRKKLQTIAHTLENRLIGLPEINSVQKEGYLKEEIQILLDPEKMIQHRLSVSSVIATINSANVRQPAGVLESTQEERITLDGEMIQKSDLFKLPLLGNFETPLLLMKEIATVQEGFEKTTKVFKINGREGILFSVVKNSNIGILRAVAAIKKEVNKFSAQVGQKEKVEIIFFDDESSDVRNRISIIKGNGLLGFILILSALFIFLSFKAGFWVAAGIPFTFGFTLIIANLIGYTINNITLAAVIIVMGMVVDDAIVVSENIIRLQSEGMPRGQAVVAGTVYVLLPITASILTTCVAFLPLWAFEGRLAMFISPIPTIVSLMLLASLVESVLILPAHLNLDIPRSLRLVFSLGLIIPVEKYFSRQEQAVPGLPRTDRAWFVTLEGKYALAVRGLLRYAPLVIIFFAVYSFLAFFTMRKKMKFVLFPREEATEVRIAAEAPDGFRRYQTARLAEKLEEVFFPYLGKEALGIVTMVGTTHRKESYLENYIYLRIELTDAERRDKTLKELMQEWKQKIKTLKGFKKVQFSERRFGMQSGAPIEIMVQENNNLQRKKVSALLLEKMKMVPGLTSVETGSSYQSPEYVFRMKRDLLKRLAIEAADIGTLLRTILDGKILYSFLVGDEEKDVRLTMSPAYKEDINSILNIKVHNANGYLVPLRKIIYYKKSDSEKEIQRVNRQRITRIYADIAPTSKKTPLEFAQILENEIFPTLGETSPSTIFSFDGEIRFTRESTGFFPLAIAMAVFLIYFILTLQFQSLTRPLLILCTIPPALASVIFVFLLHGMNKYGFFGIIGAIGLAGVVVNDAIVMIKKLDDSYQASPVMLTDGDISGIAASRLKAVLLTTITTVAGLFPTAYGIFGFDSMLAEMMLALAWGLAFGTLITLILIPALFKSLIQLEKYFVEK